MTVYFFPNVYDAASAAASLRKRSQYAERTARGCRAMIWNGFSYDYYFPVACREDRRALALRHAASRYELLAGL